MKNLTGNSAQYNRLLKFTFGKSPYKEKREKGSQRLQWLVWITIEQDNHILWNRP